MYKVARYSTTQKLPREILLTTVLLLFTWVLQLRYPPLSFPHIGLVVLSALSIAAILLPMRLYRASENTPPHPLHPAVLPGGLFLIWVLSRWGMQGFAHQGHEEVMTIAWGTLWMLVSYCLAYWTSRAVGRNGKYRVVAGFLLTTCIVGLLCGLHAIWQYFYQYAHNYQTLLAEIGNRPPNRTELGLLHHLQLRRVASIWGDPNILAAFSAITICCATELFLVPPLRRHTRAIRAFALTSGLLCLIAIILSGSRGGILDLLLIAAFYSVLLFKRRPGRPRRQPDGTITRRKKPHRAAPILLIAIALLALYPALPTTASTTSTTIPTETPTATTGLTWRTGTITERLHYYDVGLQMIALSPITGLGPGSVEQYFGRLKDESARESRYLHNWPLQVAAEYGLLGLGLLVTFFAAIAVSALRNRLWNRPIGRALPVMIAVILFDGLIQLSWNQREIVSILGLITGLAISITMPPPHRASPIRRAVRMIICMIGVIAFTIMESQFLAGQSNKLLARDLMYSTDPAAPSEAARLWRKASTWMPRDPAPWVSRATLARDQGDLTAARRLLDKAIALEPDSAAIHAEMAYTFVLLGEAEKADNHLTKALEIYPSNPEYHYQYASLLADQGNITRALPHALKAIQLNYMDENTDRYQALLHQLQSQGTPPQP